MNLNIIAYNIIAYIWTLYDVFLVKLNNFIGKSSPNLPIIDNNIPKIIPTIKL